MVKGVCFLPLKTRKALENQGLQRNSLYNHAEGVYIINAKHCISSTRSVVYHQATGKYTLARDEIQGRLCRPWWYTPHFARWWYAKPVAWIKKYTLFRVCIFWLPELGSNQWHHDYQSCALPTELSRNIGKIILNYNSRAVMRTSLHRRIVIAYRLR